MASTLQFLSIEIDKEPEALERQRGSLLNSLDNIEGEVQNPPVFETTRTTKEHITNCSSDGPGELEASLLEGCNNVLSVIDKELEGEAAARARQPLYEFLDTRVQSQLDMMRRRSE